MVMRALENTSRPLVFVTSAVSGFHPAKLREIQLYGTADSVVINSGSKRSFFLTSKRPFTMANFLDKLRPWTGWTENPIGSRWEYFARERLRLTGRPVGLPEHLLTRQGLSLYREAVRDFSD